MRKKETIRRRIALVTALTVLSIGLMSGCSAGRNKSEADRGVRAFDTVESVYPEEEKMKKMDMPMEEDLYIDEGYASDQGEAKDIYSASYINAAAVQKEKLIIRNMLNVETKSFLTYVEELEKLTESNQAYIQEQSIYNGSISGNEVRNAYYVIRVPKTNVSVFAEALKKLEGKIIRQEVNVENVTQRYLDVQRRVNVNKAKEERLTELLKKAENMKDLITIEKEIAGLVSERESMETELIELDHNVTYDYYTIHINEVREYKEVKKEKSFGADLAYAFDSSIRNFVEFLQDVVLFFVYSWIFWLLLIVIVVVAVKIIKRCLGKYSKKKGKKNTSKTNTAVTNTAETGTVDTNKEK